MIPLNRTQLGVNIDHIATLRQARGTRYPDPVKAALDAEEAGADGITLHLREDRRHIQDADVYRLKERLQTRMNLEIAVTEEMLTIADSVRPDHVCLVPEQRHELTTEGGLNILAREERIRRACQRMADVDIAVSLFIDPDPEQIQAAARCHASAIELHTGHYAEASLSPQQYKIEWERLRSSVRLGRELGLTVNAGHGLNYQNVEPVAAIPGLGELNIGHAIIARAMFTGLKQAVHDMRTLIMAAFHHHQVKQ